MVPENQKAGAGYHIGLFLALAFLPFMLGACSSSPQTASSLSTPRVHVVVIEQFKFVPGSLSIRPGDRVRWENRDLVPHLIADTRVGKWKSQDMKPGQSFTFEVRETSSYTCRLHPTMQGRIELVGDSP